MPFRALLAAILPRPTIAALAVLAAFVAFMPSTARATTYDDCRVCTDRPPMD